MNVFNTPDPLHLQDWEEQDEPSASDPHRNEQIDVYTALRARFAGPDCYVSFDRWLRMDEANPHDLLEVDILVAQGVPDRTTEDHYLPWKEGKAPDVLIEFLSKESLRADRVVKPVRYARLGVREYFVINPAGLYAPHAVRIEGWSLNTEGGKAPLPAASDGGVNSTVLPVRLVVRFNHLFVLDQETGEPITEVQQMRLSYLREVERAEAAEAHARAEVDARRQAEDELQRLRDLLDRH